MEIRSSTILRLRDALLESGARQGSVSSSAYRTLFSRKMLTKAENAAIERVAASAESMFLVIAADLQVTQSELIALRGAVRGLSSEVLSDDIVQLMMEQYADQLREDGLDQRLQAIAATLDATEAQNVFSSGRTRLVCARVELLVSGVLGRGLPAIAGSVAAAVRQTTLSALASSCTHTRLRRSLSTHSSYDRCRFDVFRDHLRVGASWQRKSAW